jgi:hypothetical protein
VKVGEFVPQLSLDQLFGILFVEFSTEGLAIRLAPAAAEFLGLDKNTIKAKNNGRERTKNIFDSNLIGL